MRLLENTWLPQVISWVRYALIACYFQHDGILRFLFPNRRMDKYSNWLMCWSRAIFTLQHLPLSSQKKVPQFLGSPPTDCLIYPHGCTAVALRSMRTSLQAASAGVGVGIGKLQQAGHFQSQTPLQSQEPCQAFLMYWKFGVSDLIYTKEAVRDGPCREGWPKLWLLSGQGSPSRTNRKPSLSIMYSHWE